MLTFLADIKPDRLIVRHMLSFSEEVVERLYTTIVRKRR